MVGAVAMAMATAACGGGKEDFEKWKAEQEALEAASAKARAAAQPPATAKAAAAPVELEQRTVAKQKATIQVPKGARTLAESDAFTTYSLALDKLWEINVQVLGSGEATVDAAKKRATTLGGKVKTAEEKDGKIVVVMEPTGKLQEVHTYLPKHGAVCKGPSARLDELKAICTSLAPAS